MQELDLKELFNIFWNKKFQIILIVAIFTVIGIIYTIGFITPIYTSKTTLVLVSSTSTDTETDAKMITTTDLTLNSKLVSTYSELVKSKNILRTVITNLGIKIDEDSLRNNVTVKAVEDTELIEIAVKNENPSYAAQTANEIAKVFTEKVKDIYNINNVQIVDEAEISDEPSNINNAKDIAMFTCIGIVLAVVYVIVVNMLDTTIKSAEDVEVTFDVPVLASIPMTKNLGNERGKRR